MKAYMFYHFLDAIASVELHMSLIDWLIGWRFTNGH